MRARTSALTAVFLVAAVTLAGCGGATRRGAAGPPSPQPAGAADGARPGIVRARADSARYPYTAADVRFMSSMIGHHTQAVTIARWAPTHGASAAVRTLAARIANGQQDEIATMRRWLADRRQPVPEAHPTGTMTHPSQGSGQALAGHEMHGMTMPGMLTEAQLRQLDQASGYEFDRLFLTFMIQHHRGAVSMVEALFGTPAAGQDDTVFKFASDVNVDQITEIARMQKLLAGLTFGTPAP